jgi:hypothetical protein
MCLTVNNPSDPCCESVPPIPLYGRISRNVFPTFIPDDIGISTAAWSFGVTGEPGASFDALCAYHHFTTPNKRTTAVFDILPPVRWSNVVPADDGGSFDHWFELADQQYTAGQAVLLSGSAVRDRLIPRDWHCRFSRNIAIVDGVPFPFQCTMNAAKNGYRQLALQAIAPDLTPWLVDLNVFPVEMQVVAMRHVINGVAQAVKTGPAVSALYGSNPNNLPADPWSVRLNPNDRHEIDVWYKIGVWSLLNMQSQTMIPGKGCAYIPTRLVSNGSMRFVSSSHAVFYRNVDFSPNFNRARHTYELSLAGHTGWTLKDGSNGPHVMRTDGEWEGGSYEGGAVLFNDSESAYCTGIRLDFKREIAQVLFSPGPAMRSANPGMGQCFLYRSDDNQGLYRRSTISADYGEIQHAASGRFQQDGTTVFRLVPWSVQGGFTEYGSSGTNNFFQFHNTDARIASAPLPPSFRNVPRTITVKRVNL